MTHMWQRGARAAGVSLALALVGAVALFSTLNASRVHPAPLSNTLESPESVAQAVLVAMRLGDLARLRELSVDESEFERLVWPYLPTSRPDRNVPMAFAWNMLHQTSEGYLRQTVARFERDLPDVGRVEFAGARSDYGEVSVYRETELVVVEPDGHERTVRLFGSMIEQNGAWKVFSYVVDD